MATVLFSFFAPAPMSRDFQQAAVARDELTLLVEECARLQRSGGEAAVVNRLSEEAVACFVEMGTPEPEARAALRQEIQGAVDPVLPLRRLVAEQRTLRRLGLLGAVAGEL
jgi:hypothetical protein